MKRLFVALWPPEDVLDRLAALPRPEIDGLRWTHRDQWHVTLRFLGPVAQAEPVVDALTTIEAAPATAVLGPAVDRFAQRILHVPVAGLDAIAGAVVDATAHIGKPPDYRPFHGHVTLARVAKHAKVDLRPLTEVPVAAEWEARTLCIVESRLAPTGARYRVIEELPLMRPPQPGAAAGRPAPPQDGGPRRTS